jgi:hypothetical protein
VIDAPRVIEVDNGDFLTLLEQWLPMNLDTQGQEPVVLLNHPATSGSPRDREYGIDDFEGDVEWLEALDRHAPLMNLINGPSHAEGTNLPNSAPSESEFQRYLNIGLHVAPTADQDNHKRNWGDSTRARTGLLAPSLTKASLLTAMRQRHAYATEDRNLRIVSRVNGELMGARIVGAAVPAAGTALSISVAIADDDEPAAGYTMEVFSDQIGGTDVATLVRTQTVSGDGTHTITGVTYQGGAQYVYLRIRQADGNRAWTAPVWLEPMSTSGGNGGGPEDGDAAVTMSLVVDPVAETARIANIGTASVDLTGWRLVSVRGNQVFDQFPAGFVLAPGQSVTVTSGAGAAQGAGFLRWTNDNIWNNSGDPGQLLDNDGNVVAATGN